MFLEQRRLRFYVPYECIISRWHSCLEYCSLLQMFISRCKRLSLRLSIACILFLYSVTLKLKFKLPIPRSKSHIWMLLQLHHHVSPLTNETIRKLEKFGNNNNNKIHMEMKCKQMTWILFFVDIKDLLSISRLVFTCWWRVVGKA